MKIAHLTTVHPSDDIRIYRKEVLSLKQAGFDVSLVGPALDNGKTLQVPHITIPRFRNRFFRMILGPFLALIQVIRNKIKVVHFHDPEFLPAALILKLLGKKIVYDAHEDIPEQILTKSYLPLNVRKPLSSIVKSVEHFCVSHFDMIVAVVEPLEKRLSKNKKHSIVLRNFPKLDEFNDFLNQEHPVNSSGKYAIYAGGVTEIRGFVQMAEASQRSKIPVVTIGKMQEKKIVTYYDKNHHNYPNLRYISYIPFREVLDYYKNALCGLLLYQPTPNNMNSSPNKMFEYMAAGLPVVASDFPMWRAIIESEQCGICVDPTKPEEIAQAINFYFDHPEIARQHGVHGRRAVLEKYNWEKEAEKLIEAYNTLLKN
jgi:glycosyltransferase involved in cell wall biosynthesis